MSALPSRIQELQALPTEVDMRVLRAGVQAGMHDLRGMAERLPAVYHDSDYGAGQSLARALVRRYDEGGPEALEDQRHFNPGQPRLPS